MASDTRSKKTAAEKRAEALELRIAGWSFQAIADEVGYGNKGSACRAVRQELANIPREAAEQAREMELTRLDELQSAVWNAAIGGDQFAVDRALKIIESRARMLGLYNLTDNADPGAEQAKAALTAFLQVATAAAAPLALPTTDGEAAA